MTLSESQNERELVQHGIRYLDMGACYNSGFKSCALYPEECNTSAGDTFSAHDQSSYTMSMCNPNDYKIGRCEKENTCALRADDCAEDKSVSNFRNEDDYCTHQRDKSIPWDVDAPSFTQFGSCKNIETNAHFCIYSPEDCDLSGKEVYATPAETKSAGVDCDCSQVHVTGCKTDSNRVMCAVNPASCNPTYMYKLTPLEQRADRESGVDQLDCRLCRKSNTIKPTPSPTVVGGGAPTNGNILATTTGTPTATPKVETGKTSNSSKDNSTTPIIIGASVGGAVVLAVLVLVFVKLGLFKKKSSKEFDTTTIDTGPSNFEIAF